MPSIHNSKTLPCRAEDIYRVVADIERYPERLNYIKSVRILRQDGNDMTAKVAVGIGPVQFTYECDIVFTPPHRIFITATQKPFKRLEAEWRFTALSPATTEVDYRLDSQFASSLMERMAGAMLGQQLHYSLRAFESLLRKS